MSLPIWERGLKLTALGVQVYPMHVAPYMGAWIETDTVYKLGRGPEGRSLYGSVD